MRSSITRALHVPRRSLGLFPAGLGGRYYQHVSSSQYRGGFSSNIAQRSIPRPRFFQTNSAAVGSTHVASESTVYALSTAPGRAGIAVIRISGPACIEIYQALCPGRKLPKPRYASLRTLYEPHVAPTKNTILDAGALALYFPAPNTVTGEDILELHVHGGPAIVKAVLSAISKCATVDSGRSPIRYAEAGEFTRRAFLNGRLDLTQVEALGDTLAADTEQQRRLAVRGSSDALGNRYEAWRQLLLYARGELEALIDFSEDQHFDESPFEFMSSVALQVRYLKRQLDLHIQNAAKGELLRSGISIALLGAPNAGKSSLLNRIVGREAAIVSQEEGTTRDIVDVSVDIGGWLCRLGDMAGLRSGIGRSGGSSIIGEVEKEGIRRAKARALESDVVVVVLSLETDAAGRTTLSLDQEVVEAVNDCIAAQKAIVVAINKTDKSNSESIEIDRTAQTQLQQVVPDLLRNEIYKISCKEAEDPSITDPDPGNIQRFLNGLIQTFEEISKPKTEEEEEFQENTEKSEYTLPATSPSYWEESLGVTHRQKSSLEECVYHLNAFLSRAEPPQNTVASNAKMEKEEHGTIDGEVEIDIVMAAEELRAAADCLARLTGRGERGDVEDVLGVVFERYASGVRVSDWRKDD